MDNYENFENNAWTHAAARQRSDEQLALGLGLFSIGLGLAEVTAPGKLAELIGMKDGDSTRSLLQFYGYRELAAGLGILSQPHAAKWVWGRVAGDLLDLATLGSAFTLKDTDKMKLAAATAAVAGVTALDVFCAQQLSRKEDQVAPESTPEVKISKSIIINRGPEEVYQFWRNFENLPRFMSNLESVQIVGDRHSHWRARGPAGVTFAWDAELVADRPNSLIAWRSVPGSEIENGGSVNFSQAPGGRGTLVRVQLEYVPPAGRLGANLAKLIGKEPGQQVYGDLRRFKQVMETGEVVNSDASIHRGMHPAKPSARHTEVYR